jgi:hypothetical protein
LDHILQGLHLINNILLEALGATRSHISGAEELHLRVNRAHRRERALQLQLGLLHHILQPAQIVPLDLPLGNGLTDLAFDGVVVLCRKPDL